MPPRICLSAFRHRLQADMAVWPFGSGAAGQVRSRDIRADRPTLPGGFSSSVNSRASIHLFGRVCHSRYCRRLLRRGVGDFPLSPRRRTGQQGISVPRRLSALWIPSAPFCVRVVASPFGRFDYRERRQPLPLASDSGVLRVPGAAPHRAQAHTASLWAPAAIAQSSPHPRQTYR